MSKICLDVYNASLVDATEERKAMIAEGAEIITDLGDLIFKDVKEGDILWDCHLGFGTVAFKINGWLGDFSLEFKERNTYQNYRFNGSLVSCQNKDLRMLFDKVSDIKKIILSHFSLVTLESYEHKMVRDLQDELDNDPTQLKIIFSECEENKGIKFECVDTNLKHWNIHIFNSCVSFSDFNKEMLI